MSKFQFFHLFKFPAFIFLNVKILFLFKKEPLSVAGPSVTVKTSSVQVLLNDNVALPCLAQGYPVPEIR
jgi:hypothetical protein